MRLRFLSAPAQRWLISVLLVVLSVRALIPAGFMPSSEHPFSFEICPDGFPTQLLHSDASDDMPAHHHHHAGGDEQPAPKSTHTGHGQSARAEHCVFAAAATVGPAPYTTAAVVELSSSAAPESNFATPVTTTQRHRVQQPRAPPTLS
jgi:hypothetical protein